MDNNLIQEVHQETEIQYPHSHAFREELEDKSGMRGFDDGVPKNN